MAVGEAKETSRERDPCINIHAMHNACVHLEFSGPMAMGVSSNQRPIRVVHASRRASRSQLSRHCTTLYLCTLIYVSFSSTNPLVAGQAQVSLCFPDNRRLHAKRKFQSPDRRGDKGINFVKRVTQQWHSSYLENDYERTRTGLKTVELQAVEEKRLIWGV